MTKDEIRRRCRKVYVEVRNGKIFNYLGSKRNPPGEYEFVSMCRRKEYAEHVMKQAQQETGYHWQSVEDWNQKRQVVEFYLVPAKKIDS